MLVALGLTTGVLAAVVAWATLLPQPSPPRRAPALALPTAPAEPADRSASTPTTGPRAPTTAPTPSTVPRAVSRPTTTGGSATAQAAATAGTTTSSEGFSTLGATSTQPQPQVTGPTTTTGPTTPATTTFTIQLSGAAEVCATAPGTCGGPGTGTATITIDRQARTRSLCYSITTQNVALPLLAGHLHGGPVGEAGPVVVPLFTEAVSSATLGPTCLTDLDKRLLKAILRNPKDYYINVHNAPFPNGAVRGQLA